MNVSSLTGSLENVYSAFHKSEFIYPDPLYLVRRFACTRIREIGGLLIALLAMGNVKAMLKALENLIKRLDFLCRPSATWQQGEVRDVLGGFVYRFFTEKHLYLLMNAIRRVLEEYGTLNAAFSAGVRPDEDTFVPALIRFTELMYGRADGDISFLLPDPAKGSACKRLFLYLRWMVRKDDIDPGGWDFPGRDHPLSLLVVPVDTHMLHLGRLLGLTARKQADLRTALEITEAFRLIRPDDPVRYDFSLTRLGIHPDLRYEFLNSAG